MEATSCLFTCLMPGNQWCTFAALKKEEGVAEVRQNERSIGMKKPREKENKRQNMVCCIDPCMGVLLNR